MKIAVVVTRSLRGSGFATRISSMLAAYAAGGNQVDVFHFRFPHEEELPSSVAALVGRYVPVPLGRARYRQHASLLPPLAWNCARANAATVDEQTRYDVVQAETSNTWGIAQTLSAAKRIVVLHDDDSARLKGVAKAAGGVRSLIADASAVKYSRLQRIVLEEADKIWFVSEVERDRLVAKVPQASTGVVPNGAGDELWSVPPLEDGSCSEVLFVGPASYEANSSGLAWFLKDVWPRAKERASGAHVRIVGVGWERFDQPPGVSFVGWRGSLVDEYSRARVVIAPLFAGGGTKLKVVEAMASARPVVTTPLGAEGLPPSAGVRVCVDAQEFATEVVRFLGDPRAASEAGAANRSAVDDLRWSSIWSRASSDLDELVGAQL